MALKEEIRLLHNQGKSYKQISKLLDCSKSTISYHIGQKQSKYSLKEIIPNKNIRTAIKNKIKKFTISSKILDYSLDEFFKFITNNPFCAICNLQIKYDNIREWQFKATTSSIKSLTIEHRACQSCPIHNIIYQNSLSRCNKCNAGRVAKRRIKTKKLLVEAFGGKCQVCGYNKCYNSLVFHHKNPQTKKFTISGEGVTRSYAAMYEEALKCYLVCANCHSEIHAGLHPELLAR